MAKSLGPDHEGYRGPSAAPISAPVWKRRHYIDRPAALREVAAELARAQVIAIDAEFVQARGSRHGTDQSHRLALLQFARDDEHSDSYVVDALRLPDLSPLQAALEDARILKLFHGISADARMLATRGLVAHQTLDLEAASRSIFGQRESGLQAMLARACNIRLDKSLQRADWARRPLTPAMVAYAARDAEMTLVLYGWLAANYSWAVGLHLQPADEPTPAIAPWLLGYIEGPRGRPIELALVEAGLDGDTAGQEAALRTALAAVHHPSQRARLMRIICDLGLIGLGPDLRPFLASPASEERAGAVRAIGRMRLPAANELARPLLEDAVREVRQAAQLALAQQHGGVTAPPAPTRATRQANGIWTIGEAPTDAGGDPDDPNDWRTALRARFGISAGAGED
ncbi:MAG TPA: HEAT repeat domain-containing protein [Ktedonobacterales bacterium]